MIKAIICPECGTIEKVNSYDNWKDCPGCYGQGHMYRMLSLVELQMSTHQHYCNGYTEVAQKRTSYMLAMVRYLTIHECLSNACNEYYEAQQAGLDSNAAWKCATEGLNKLYECECGHTEPYGFVPEAGCPLHDTEE